MNKTLSQQLESLKQQKALMLIFVFLFVVVIIWTMMSLFTSQKKVAISAELRTLSKPLIPTMNAKILDSISERRAFSDGELQGFPIYKVVSTRDGGESRLVDISNKIDILETPTPTPTPPTASASSELSAPNVQDDSATNLFGVTSNPPELPVSDNEIESLEKSVIRDLL